MPLDVVIVSGSRADWGQLTMPARRLAADPRIALRILATGQHLTPSSGRSLSEVAEDGFIIAAEVEMLLAADTAVAVTKSIGLAMIGFADAFARMSPDLILILGDRYEILAAASAAQVMRIPVAHIVGGDVTEGAIDDAFRHAITKLSHLHFVTNQDAALRVRQLGEAPERIHLVGSPGIDRLLAFEALDRVAFFDAVGLAPRARNLLVTFHPVTANDGSLADVDALLAALGDLDPEHGLIFTGVNADAEGRTIEARMIAFCKGRANAVYRGSLGGRFYRSALAHCDAVVGNSSSGLYEAPSFAIPTVNIGDRQKGRLKAASVIDCPPQCEAIRVGITRALGLDCAGVVNPYGDGHASERIAGVVAAIAEPRALLAKSFHDMRLTS